MNGATQPCSPRLEELQKANMQAQSSGLGCGQVGSTLSQPAQPGLRERVAMNLNRAQQEARRAEVLHELQYLLDKNPDIARILDLLEVAQILRV